MARIHLKHKEQPSGNIMYIEYMKVCGGCVVNFSFPMYWHHVWSSV